jgi:hypothetical protein
MPPAAKTFQVSPWYRPDYGQAVKWNGVPPRRAEHTDSWVSFEFSPNACILAKELFYSIDARGLNFYVSSILSWQGQRRQIKIS